MYIRAAKLSLSTSRFNRTISMNRGGQYGNILSLVIIYIVQVPLAGYTGWAVGKAHLKMASGLV